MYSRNWQEHVKHLEIVLQTLASHQLFAKLTKCRFGVTEVEYLGHLISKQGVAVDPHKIIAVKDWPQPKNQKSVRGFLGLPGYYRKFIRNFGGIAAPLTRLLTKDGFSWNTEAGEAFVKLKDTPSSPPILALPDFTQQFIIESDTCGTRLGAILSQNQRVIAYYSEALKGVALNLSIYEKEMLAIRKWRPYLLGRLFIVRTDQKSLKFLLEQRITTPAQARWLPKLMGYDYKIEYRRGQENQRPHTLSHLGEFQMIALSLPVADWWEKLQVEVREDSFYQNISQQESRLQDFQMKDCVYILNGKIFLSTYSFLIPLVLKEFHSSPLGGYFEYEKTISKIRQTFHWAGLNRMVKEFIKTCVICQQNKYETLKPAGLLHPLPIPETI